MYNLIPGIELPAAGCISTAGRNHARTVDYKLQSRIQNLCTLIITISLTPRAKVLLANSQLYYLHDMDASDTSTGLCLIQYS